MMKMDMGLGIVGLSCDPNTWDLEAGRSGVENPLSLQMEFSANLSCLRPCLKNKQRDGI